MPLQSKVKISVVVPCYACDDCLVELHKRLTAVLTSITESYEIILVNDASPANDWQVIQELAANDPKVKALNFVRNFGQHYALTAGLDFSSGEWIIVMDADLQDRPEEILQFYAKALEGYDVVLGRRVDRQDSLIKKAIASLFYRFYDLLTGQVTDNTVGNFGIYSRTVVDNYCAMREQARNFSQFMRWLGFNTAYVNITHSERFSGKSSYNLLRMIKLASSTILSLSNTPLYLSVQLGFVIAVTAFIYGLFLIFRYCMYQTIIEGWTSVMVSVYFLAGLILFNIGILGLYIGKTFNETKRRPLYIVKEKINF